MKIISQPGDFEIFQIPNNYYHERTHACTKNGMTHKIKSTWTYEMKKKLNVPINMTEKEENSNLKKEVNKL